jgi:hypothetical protein
VAILPVARSAGDQRDGDDNGTFHARHSQELPDLVADEELVGEPRGLVGELPGRGAGHDQVGNDQVAGELPGRRPSPASSPIYPIGYTGRQDYVIGQELRPRARLARDQEPAVVGPADEVIAERDLLAQWAVKEKRSPRIQGR